MQLFKSYAADSDKNNSISQYPEGRKMDAHLCFPELQKAQNSSITSSYTKIIPKEKSQKEESRGFSTIPNPTNTSRSLGKKEASQSTVILMHFQIARIIIILIFNKMIKYIRLPKHNIHRYIFKQKSTQQKSKPT